MKKKMILSFTSLLFGFMEEKISVEEIRNIDLIIFGCSIDHILKFDTTVPKEVSSCNKEYEAVYSDDQVGLDQIEPDILIKWKELKDILADLNSAGKIRWKYDERNDYPTIIQQFENEYTIFYRGTRSS